MRLASNACRDVWRIWCANTRYRCNPLKFPAIDNGQTAALLFPRSAAVVVLTPIKMRPINRFLPPLCDATHFWLQLRCLIAAMMAENNMVQPLIKLPDYA